jgi:Putative zinc-finger
MSDRVEESATMTSPTHPDLETLGRFVLGRLDRRAMDRVEAHLGCCSSCGRAAMQIPDDRLVALLRIHPAGPAAGRSPDGATKSP